MADVSPRALPNFLEFPSQWLQVYPQWQGADEVAEYSRTDDSAAIADYDGLSDTVFGFTQASSYGKNVHPSTSTTSGIHSLKRHNVWKRQVNKFKLRKKVLNPNHFALGVTVGKGHFGEVQLATNKKDNSKVAVKIVRQGPDGFRQLPEEFLREAELLSQCDHPNLLKLVGVCAVSTVEPWIVTEYMADGNLKKFLLERRAERIPSSHLVTIAAQVASAMLYMSASPRRIIHRDLAARNVLVNGTMEDGGPLVKVADLGLARRLDMGQELYRPTRSRPFAPRWAAPEVIQNSNFSVKSDVWAFGMLLYEIMSRGMNPFPGCTKQEILMLVVGANHENFPMPKPYDCPQAVYDLMHFCWMKDPRYRPTFEQIVRILNNANDGFEENTRL